MAASCGLRSLWLDCTDLQADLHKKDMIFILLKNNRFFKIEMSIKIIELYKPTFFPAQHSWA